MKRSQFDNTLLSLAFFFLSACAILSNPETREAQILPPEELYGELFFDVQTDEGVFQDSKTFVDAVPLYDVAKIRRDYTQLEGKSPNDISKFVSENFAVPDQ